MFQYQRIRHTSRVPAAAGFVVRVPHVLSELAVKQKLNSGSSILISQDILICHSRVSAGVSNNISRESQDSTRPGTGNSTG